MGPQVVKTEQDFLSSLEKSIGTGNLVQTNYKEIAERLGLKFWSISLKKKLDKLTDSGKISIESITANKFSLIIIDPESSKQEKTSNESEEIRIKRKYVKSENYDKLRELRTTGSNVIPINNKISDEIIDKLSDEINKEIINEPVIEEFNIDAAFDEFANNVLALFARAKELEAENIRLKFEVENAREREKKWIARAIEYKEQLYRR